MKSRKAMVIVIFVLLVGILDSISDAAEKLDLKLRLKPGEKRSMRITTRQNIAMTMMGKQQAVGHTKTVGMQFEVKEVDAVGTVSVKVTYLTLQEKTKIGEKERGYDSTKPVRTGDNLGQIYSAMMGESFAMKITSKGKIVELNGVDKMFLSMAEKLMTHEDESIKERLKERAEQAIDRINKRYGSREKRKEVLKEQIKNFPGFSEQSIKSILSNMTAEFPGRTVEVGDSWKDKVIVSAGSATPVEIGGTYTLKGHDRGTVTINVSGKRDLGDKPIISETGPLKSSTRLAGLYNATVTVDEKTGWLLSKRANVSFTGETKVAGSKQAPQGQTIQMSIEASVSVEPMESIRDN